MIDFFSERIGVPYAYPRYSRSPSPSSSSAVLENATTTTLTELVLLDERAAIDHDVEGLVSHELARQWWGDLLTCARMVARGAASSLNGLRPAQTPNFAATLSGGYDEEGKGGQLVVRRVGPQFEDDLNSRTLKAATTVDAFASWPLTKNLLLIGRAENIFDKLVMAGINGDASIERATPRTVDRLAAPLRRVE